MWYISQGYPEKWLMQLQSTKADGEDQQDRDSGKSCIWNPKAVKLEIKKS